ncbi:Putative MSHA biogenesis protein MshL [Candidatus Phycorickettsia trachydisci]|uniref:MSHA biogenesis protein MshL n=1 Tax=Candidatus Phycorickettsia trachydisci TaxID=2115978 RepID=A0A2P1P8G4_9RICK|nr:secretin N-terminal domain-containing protein [Candidatus Phycorickettsia trachydisci]AVP87535.1 Putative MSHA biogenesis protein MshL [Candidatus Phycorickettsia trachydisci]
MRNKLKIFLGILVLLFGCNKKFPKEFNQNIQDLNKFQTFTEVQGEAKPIETINAIKHRYCKRADIHFKELTFRNLSLLLSRIYNTQINITQNPDLLLTINYSNICLEDLLDQLGGLYNIGYAKSNFGYNLDYKTLKTKFFTINYHNFKRSGSSTTSIQGGSSLSSSTGGSNSGQTTIQTQTEDSFWNNIAQNLNILLGVVGQTNTALTSNPMASDGEPSFSIYKESGIIVVSAFPKAMKNVEKFINKVNKICSKQVHIEAKILEVTLSDEFSTGIDWNILETLRSGMTLTSSDSINSKLDMSMPSSRMTIKATNQNTFKSTIEALATQGKVSVLSSPKISVLNNQKAVFKFGEDQYHITGVTSSTSSSSNNNNNNNTNNAIATPTLTAMFSGISLDATPTITHNNQVIMHVHPTVTTINEEDRSFKLSGQESTIPLASVDTREADTVVKARNGDIIVVGGLMQNTVRMIRSGPATKIKFFERIFGTKQEHVERKELVLLLRPVVVDSETAKPDFSRYLLDEEGEILEPRPSIVEFDE